MLPSRNRDSSTADWAPSSKAVESEPTRPVAKALTTLRAIMKTRWNLTSFPPPFPRVSLDFRVKKFIVRAYLPVLEGYPHKKGIPIYAVW